MSHTNFNYSKTFKFYLCLNYVKINYSNYVKINYIISEKKESKDKTRFNVLQKLYFQGDSGVGKSSLISQYVTKRFYNQHKTNMCADFLRKTLLLMIGL